MNVNKVNATNFKGESAIAIGNALFNTENINRLYYNNKDEAIVVDMGYNQHFTIKNCSEEIFKKTLAAYEKVGNKISYVA